VCDLKSALTAGAVGIDPDDHPLEAAKKSFAL
jgi:hypothetical protein